MRNAPVDFLPGALHVDGIKASLLALAHRTDVVVLYTSYLSQDLLQFNFVEGDSVIQGV